MKAIQTLKALLMVSATAGGLLAPCSLLAQGTNPPPVVVPQDRDDRDLLKDLKGVPDNIKNLILNFDQTRDKYLMEQRLLLIKLRNATTPEERQQLRQLLQQNRAEFLSELKAFREQLKDDLQAIRREITAPEFRRIIDAAHDIKDPSHYHKGQGRP